MNEPYAYTVTSVLLKPLREFITGLINDDTPIEQRYLDDVVNWCINTEDYTPHPESSRFILELRNRVDSYPELHAQLIQQVMNAKTAIYANIQSVDQYFNPSEPHYLNSCYHVVVLQMVP